MWPPPMRHPSQYMGGGRPPPAYPSRELLPMDYPPGPSALPLLPPPPPIGLAAANPFGADERSMPPWHRRMGGDQLLNDSWKAADSSWRQQPRQFGPYSNHEFYRQQYTQLPLSRPHANFHPPPLQHLNPPNSFATPTPNLHYAGELMPMHSFESPSGGHVAVPPEYAAARADYERRLREHCEETRKMNSASAVASNFCDFSSAANGGSENAVKAAGEGGVELLTQPSARRIRIRWTFRMPDTNDKLKLHLAVHLEKLEGGSARGARANELGLILEKTLPVHIMHAEFNALPGSLYRIDLRLIDSKNNQLASGTVYERAIFSLEEMKVLMQKAINHTGTEMQPFTFLYRCKPKIYWDYVVSETRAEMNVYGKDSNGQAASPINTAISGLFFSARLDPKGHVPTQSPFGEVRFMLPAYMLLQPHLNLYFADFYCNSKPHYVTVVVCREHSDADRLCRRTLLPLAPFDNPFLLFQHSTSPTTPVTYSANRNVWVEIYYTDNVPLSWGHLHHIHTFGVGTSKIGGLPHNKGCRVCNLYPQGPSAAELVAYPLPENAEQISVEKAEEMVREAENAELVDDDGEEGRRTTTDGGERWENGGEVEDGTKTNTDNNRQVPFEELQNRLQQIERSVGKAALVAAHSANGSGGDGISSSAQIFTELVQQIGGFLLEMRKDFNDLNAQIDATETIIWTEQNEEEPTGLELVDEAFADVDALLRDDDDQKIEQCIDVSLSVHETVDALLSRVHKLEQYGEGEEEEQQTNKQQSRRLRRRSSSSNSSVAVIEEKRHCRRESD